MSTFYKVLKNTGIMLVGNIIFRLISLFVVIFLARYLGVESFGKYNFIFAYIGFFGIITDLGLGTILVREMARKNESMAKMLGNAYIIKIILSSLAIFLSILTITLMGYPADTTTYIYMATIILLFQSFNDTFRTVFQTTLKMEYDIISKLTYKIVSATLIFYLIMVKGTLFQIILVLIFSEILRTLLNYAFSRKIVIAKFDIDLTLWKCLFKESLPIALSSVFLVIYNRIDIIMLSLMKGDLAVGLYSAAYSLSEPLVLIPYAIVTSLFPVMSRSFKSSTDTLAKSYGMGFKSIIILMLPITFGTMLLSDRIILLIYDYSYAGSITALQILIWSLFLVSVNYLLISILTSIDKQKLATLSMGVCVVANIVLNYLLIPLYSYNGASIATVATELILLLMSLYFVHANIVTPPIHRLYQKPLAACLVMGVSVYCLNNFTDINIYLIIISAAIVYTLVLLRMKIFSTEEKAIIRRILKI